MPYRKRYKKRYRKKPLNKAQYRQVAKIANKQIHKASELKTVDDQPSNIAMTTAAPTTKFRKITLPVQGLEGSERIGDSVYLRGVNFRSFLENELDVDLSARVIMLQTFDDQDTGLEYQDVIQNTDPGGVSINSFYVTDPPRKFKILHDSVHHWDSNPNSLGRRSVNISVKGKQLKIHKPDFSDPTTGNCTGQIWYTAFSNVADKGNMVSIQTRSRYFDN